MNQQLNQPPLPLPRHLDRTQPAEALPPYEPNLRGHIPALDAVRGLAIVMVTIYRFYDGPGDLGSFGRALFKVFSLGNHGVDLFFVLSGFLITGILYEAKGRAHYFRDFYMRRALRIFPLYYGALILFFVVLPWVAPAAAALYDDGAREQLWLWFYGSNILQAINQACTLKYFNHFWSLAVEEHFYLAWPLVIFLCNRRQAMLVCSGCLVFALALRIGLALAGCNHIVLEVLTPCRIDSLAAGGLLTLAARGPLGIRGLVPWARLTTIVCGVLFLLLVAFDRTSAPLPDDVRTIQSSLLAGVCGGFILLAVAVNPASWAGWCCNWSVLRFFGKYSYGMYVFQNLLVPAFVFLFPVEALISASGSVLAGRLLYILLASAGTTAVAFVSWHLYEKHFLKLKTLFGGH